MDDLLAARVVAGLDGTRFRSVEVYPSLDSTQALLLREGGRDGRVVVADHQTAGRGRAGRTWLDVPGAMVMFSALLRDVPAARAPTVSLAAGLAVARAAGPGAGLKWPNDVQIDGRKVCGILGELAPGGGFVVVGLGVNVHQRPDDFPPDLEATSLAIATGAPPRRDDLLVSILRELDGLLRSDAWMDEYRSRSVSIGRRVRVELADGSFDGTAESVRDDGALVVDGRAVIAGDVVHLR